VVRTFFYQYPNEIRRRARRANSSTPSSRRKAR
jgi:hypothetical protein